MSELLNRMIAGRLEQAVEILSREGADPRFARAYTLAASSVRHWPISMAVMYWHRGTDGLEEVPGVGPRIANVIRELLTHNRGIIRAWSEISPLTSGAVRTGGLRRRYLQRYRTPT